MALKTTKYEIFSYWQDKAITKEFQVKHIRDCSPEDEAVRLIEFPDEICCWACGMPPYYSRHSRSLRALWNNDASLDRAHILARSQGGGDQPENLFLLCPECHTESPDTTNPINFFAWVYYMRKHGSYVTRWRRAMELAAKIRGVCLEDLCEFCRLEDLDLKRQTEWRRQLVNRTALHGTSISPLSKAMAYLDLLLEQAEPKSGAAEPSKTENAPSGQEELL